MQKGMPVDLPSAIEAARHLIESARHPVALVSSWGSNEELGALKHALPGSFAAFTKQDSRPQPGERLDDDLLIRADKNPNAATASALFPRQDDEASRFTPDTDLVLVWGEGFDFARIPVGARIIFLNAYLQPENGHADVFIPISIQTERRGHYTNFEGVVSAFEPCFGKPASVADAEALFAAMLATESASA
jgi:NADH-quinone oxidoreductase subunit G